jgi:hypothetical protein
VAADNLCWRSSGELYFEMEVFEAKGAVTSALRAPTSGLQGLGMMISHGLSYRGAKYTTGEPLCPMYSQKVSVTASHRGFGEFDQFKSRCPLLCGGHFMFWIFWFHVLNKVQTNFFNLYMDYHLSHSSGQKPHSFASLQGAKLLGSSSRLVPGGEAAPPGCGPGCGNHAGGSRRDRRLLYRSLDSKYFVTEC